LKIVDNELFRTNYMSLNDNYICTQKSAKINIYSLDMELVNTITMT